MCRRKRLAEPLRGPPQRSQRAHSRRAWPRFSETNGGRLLTRLGSLRNELKLMALWLGGRTLLLHDFGFVFVEGCQQVLYGFLHFGTLVLLQWDLDLTPPLEMDVVVLQGQFVDLGCLFRHRRGKDGEVDSLAELFIGE